MQINIGEKISALRTAKNVTRERFAAFLGVDAETVCSWEDGEAYPPIEIIVVLSRYFGVTTDELLCVESMSLERRIEEYVRRYDSAMDSGNLLAAIDTMHEALRHFPDDYRFKGMLMYALCCNCDRKNTVMFTSGEIISLGEDILSGCTDDAIRLEARRLLCLHYCKALGETTNSLRHAAMLPGREYSREELLPFITNGDDKLCVLRENNRFYTASLVRSIREYADLCGESDERRMMYYNTALRTAQLIYSDGDYHALAYELMECCKSIAALHMAMGESDKALDALEAAAGFAGDYDGMSSDTDAEHTSPLIALTTSQKPDTSDTPASQTLLGELLELSCFEPLRYSEKLRGICEMLEKSDD